MQIFVALLFIFNAAISTAQYIGFRGDDTSLNTFQSVWFESINSLISGASLKTVQNHQFIGPASSSYSGSGAFFIVTVVFGNILMMNLVIGVLSERYQINLKKYGQEAWNDDMSCKIGSYVLNNKLFLPSVRYRFASGDDHDTPIFPKFDRFLQYLYCSYLFFPAYIIFEVMFHVLNPISRVLVYIPRLVHEPFPKLHEILSRGKTQC